MKLTYTYDVFTFQIFGGVSRYFVELIKRVRLLDTYSSFEVIGGLYINEYLKEVSDVWGVKVLPIKYTGSFRRLINNFIQNLWIKWNSPTVIHQTYYSDFVFEKGAKLVLTVYDMTHELYPESFADNGVTSIRKKRCCDRADKIIAISNTTKNDLIRLFGIDPEKIHVIYLANPLENITPDFRRNTLFSNYILYVGDRHGYKNFNALVQAYVRSKKTNRSFHLVCFGGGAFSPNERKYFSALGIDKNVFQISGNDHLLALYYQKARAFVCPSLYEGFGLPLLEAMSYGCPVVCSRKGSIPEVAGGAGIYFDPGSPESVQEVLEKVLFDDSLLRNLADRGRERVKEFSWQKCARETLEVYKSLAD